MNGLKNIIQQKRVFSGCVRSYELERRITQFYAPRGNDGGRFLDCFYKITADRKTRWSPRLLGKENQQKMEKKKKTDEIRNDKAVLERKKHLKDEQS